MQHKIEIQLDSQVFHEYFTKINSQVSRDIQAQIKSSQNFTNCENVKMVYYDLGNINAAYCGLGCTLHGISASFLCAVENKMQFSVINYQKAHYEKYFKKLTTKCNKDHFENIPSIFF